MHAIICPIVDVFMKKKEFNIILYQKSLGIEVSNDDLKEMSEFNPHFICFPEYFFVNQSLGNHNQTIENQEYQISRIKHISEVLQTVVIGGTMPEIEGENLFNTSFIFNRGEELGFYRKNHLFFAEEGKITPGNKFEVFEAYGIIFSVIICADVFYDKSFLTMKELGAELIFSPTFSPYKKEKVESKFKRDTEIYVRGAEIMKAPIVKVCGVPSDYIPYIQARSLIAMPDKILYRVKPEEERKEMIIKQKVIL